MNEFKVKVDSLEMSQLEKDLYRLAMIEGRFHFVYITLPKLPESKPNQYSFKSSIREYAIIQLVNFLKIRDSIRSDLKQIAREEIDITLRPFWQPIHDQREALETFRTEYYAHLQDNRTNQFSKTIEKVFYDSKFAGSWNDITFYAGCVLHYSKFMQSNFETEWFTAQSKYLLSNIANDIEVFFPRTDVIHIQDVDLELKKLTNLVINNLKEKNLNWEESRIEKVSFSYTDTPP
jgi:hypothetical protein